MTKKENILGTIATVCAVLMYVSYIPQIYGNLTGTKTSFIQPTFAAINCTLWVVYGFKKEKKEWPIILANSPGIIFGVIAAVTSLI